MRCVTALQKGSASLCVVALVRVSRRHACVRMLKSKCACSYSTFFRDGEHAHAQAHGQAHGQIEHPVHEAGVACALDAVPAEDEFRDLSEEFQRGAVKGAISLTSLIKVR